MNFANAWENKAMFLSLTGLSYDEGIQLYGAFKTEYERREDSKKTDEWGNKMKTGRKPKLAPRDLFLMVMVYLKHYPKLSLLGFIFGIHPSGVYRWLDRLTAMMKSILLEESMLPARAISTPEQFREIFADNEDVFIDGVERPIRRPVDSKRQKKFYSGKKKGTE